MNREIHNDYMIATHHQEDIGSVRSAKCSCVACCSDGQYPHQQAGSDRSILTDTMQCTHVGVSMTYCLHVQWTVNMEEYVKHMSMIKFCTEM